MDRISRAVQRLWGSVGNGRLPPSPRFAEELAEHGNGALSLVSPKVSKWSYGYQLEHLYLSTHYVLDRLEESFTGRYADERMGPWGVGMMVGGFIPRKMFPTIPPLEPQGGTLAQIVPLQQRLNERLAAIDWGMRELFASRGKSKHPRMKYLTSSQWMLFADIHHRHHIAIMRDIARSG